MTFLRTKVRAIGDIVTEQTSIEHAGEFSIGTEIGKFTIPVDVSGSHFSRQKVTQIICLENVGYISGCALVLSSSTIANVSSVSASIAQDINDLSSLITNVSSSFVTTISIFSGSTASDINDLSQLLNIVSSSAALTTTQFPLASGTIASDIDLFNTNLNTTNNNVAAITASITTLSSSINLSFNVTNNSIAAITSSNALFSASVVSDFNSVNNKVAALTSSLNTTNNNVAALTASVLFTSQSIQTAAFNNRYEDIQGSFDQSTGTAALGFEAYRAGFSLLFMSSAQNDSFNMRFQMPHSWNVSTPVHVHGHFIPVGTPVSPETIAFGWQAAWFAMGQLIPTAWVTVSSTMADVHIYVDFVDMPPPQNVSLSTSAMLLFKLCRSGSSALDTYTAVNPIGSNALNLGVLGCDCHYQQDRAGTVTELGPT
jgi:hypothetical protein